MSRQKFLTVARSFVGYKESDGSHREIIDIYNSISPLPRGYKMSYFDPWCAAFVSAAGELAELGDVIIPECSCSQMMEKYKALGRFSQSADKLQSGDLVLYDWQRDGSPDHVGIVDSIGEKIKVIEGNMSDSVGYRLLSPNSANIRGFCHPAFDAAPPDAAGDAAPGVPQPLLPSLSLGSTGETTRAAQILLIGRGCRCGPWGADGEFGSATYGAVLRYQKIKNLTPDGIIGPATWSALLGIAPLA